MLNNIFVNWNSIYKHHQSNLCRKSVDIVENGVDAKLKKLTIAVPEAISFPSKDFSAFDLFGALSNKNCDGAFLVHNADSTYDLIFVEMKSRFSTDEIYDAKNQIIESRIKLKVLLEILPNTSKLSIRDIYGIIATKELDDDQKNLWSKQQMLPDAKLNFGWRLVKYRNYDAPVLYDNRFNLPQMMNFRLFFSDSQNLLLEL